MDETASKQLTKNENFKAKCSVRRNKAEQIEMKLSIDSDSVPAHLKREQDIQAFVLKQITGTADQGLALSSLELAARATPGQTPIEQGLQNILNACQEAQPQDIVEAKLCAKEAVLYSTAMQYLIRAENMFGDSPLWYESCMKYAIKLLRLHNETIETLNRYRRQGEQRVVVQHVNVNDGGQAAFMSGNFNANTGGGGNQKNGGKTS